jgi:hypothetical protein
MCSLGRKGLLQYKKKSQKKGILQQKVEVPEKKRRETQKEG